MKSGSIFLLYTVTVLLPSIHGTDSHYSLPNVRALVVTGTNPSDGHLRALRSANARNMSPKLLRLENNTSEIEEVFEYLTSTNSTEDEILVLTPSETFVLTQEAMKLSSRVAYVAMIGGGSVVMAFLRKNTTAMPTKYDKEYDNLVELSENYKFSDGSPRPESFEEWKVSTGIYSKLKYLKIKMIQERRKMANVYDDRFCAFSGLTLAVKESLKRFMNHQEAKGISKLKDLCKKLAALGSLRHDLDIVLDYNGKVFNWPPKATPNYSMGYGETPIVYSFTHDYPPLVGESFKEMPFELSSMVTGDVGVKSRHCEACSDNETEDLNKHYGGEKNLPIIHIVVTKSVAFHLWNEFLENLLKLTYPKEKIRLTFITSDKSSITQEIETIRENSQYLEFNVLSSPNVTAIDIFEKMWEDAKSKAADFSFIVDPTARFEDFDVIQHLLKFNRRMMSPLLTIASGGVYNFAADRKGKNFSGNSLEGGFHQKYVGGNFDYVGLLQVPFSFGAVLIRNDVFRDIEIPFKTCYYECEDGDTECEAANEKVAKDRCEDDYFEGINDDDAFMWGMMFKQIQDQGVIPYISNHYEYGYIVF